MSFVHLHCHSEYSLLDGANRIDDLIRRAQELEQPALAITDHGNLHAAWEFQEKAKKAKVKPIIGMEAYVAPGDRRTEGARRAGRQAVLPSRAARARHDRLQESGQAVVARVHRRLLLQAARRPRAARASTAKGSSSRRRAWPARSRSTSMDDRDRRGARSGRVVRGLFKDRYYLEVQAHDSEGQAKLNQRIFALGEELGLPVIATNDAHFLKRDDHDAHDVLLCIGLGKDRSDADRMHYDRGLYFKSAPEIASRFTERPDVLENTLKIADEVERRVREEVPRAGVSAAAGRGDGERSAR